MNVDCTNLVKTTVCVMMQSMITTALAYDPGQGKIVQTRKILATRKTPVKMVGSVVIILQKVCELFMQDKIFNS